MASAFFSALRRPEYVKVIRRQYSRVVAAGAAAGTAGADADDFAGGSAGPGGKSRAASCGTAGVLFRAGGTLVRGGGALGKKRKPKIKRNPNKAAYAHFGRRGIER